MTNIKFNINMIVFISSFSLSGCTFFHHHSSFDDPNKRGTSLVKTEHHSGEGVLVIRKLDGQDTNPNRCLHSGLDKFLGFTKCNLEPRFISVSPGNHTYGVLYLFGDLSNKWLISSMGAELKNKYLPNNTDSTFTVKHYEELAFESEPDTTYLIERQWDEAEKEITFSVKKCVSTENKCINLDIKPTVVVSTVVAGESTSDIEKNQTPLIKQSETTQEHALPKVTSSQVATRSPRAHASILLGRFYGNKSPGQLENPGHPTSWAINIGYDFSEYLSLDGDLSYFIRDYTRMPNTTTLPGTANNRIRLTTLGLSVNGKATYPVGRWMPFIGAGVGRYSTGLLVTEPGTGLFTSQGAPSDKASFGYQLMTGIDVIVTKNKGIGFGSLGLEYRRVYLRADFGPYTNGDADIGGNMVSLTYRYHN